MAISAYRLVAQFPQYEQFGLSSQLRRAAISRPSNIAEGCGRKSKKDLAHFIQIAIGSSSEVEYQLFLAKDLKYINENTWRALNNNVIEIRKMMFAFVNKLTPQGS